MESENPFCKIYHLAIVTCVVSRILWDQNVHYNDAHPAPSILFQYSIPVFYSCYSGILFLLFYSCYSGILFLLFRDSILVIPGFYSCYSGILFLLFRDSILVIPGFYSCYSGILFLLFLDSILVIPGSLAWRTEYTSPSSELRGKNWCLILTWLTMMTSAPVVRRRTSAMHVGGSWPSLYVSSTELWEVCVYVCGVCVYVCAHVSVCACWRCMTTSLCVPLTELWEVCVCVCTCVYVCACWRLMTLAIRIWEVCVECVCTCVCVHACVCACWRFIYTYRSESLCGRVYDCVRYV